MECIEAQQAVSAALDNAPVDAAELALAKDHCRSCAECGAFVKSLVALRNAAVPEPPADLADRIMAAVNAEHARATRASAAIAASKRMPGTSTSTQPESASLRERLLDPRNRRALVTWASAAAVVLVAAGVGAVVGVRSIFAPGTSGNDITIIESTANEPYADTAASTAQPQAMASADAAAAKSAATSGFIVVNGVAYRSAGADNTVKTDSVAEVGTAETTLITGSGPRNETVLGTDDPARVFIENEEGTMLAFDRVTVSFEGRTYVLQSGPVITFGDMVTLPTTIAEPASADGSPTFEAAGDGSGGVYVLAGRDTTYGIAFAPGAKPDLSAGWTWWLPASQ